MIKIKKDIVSLEVKYEKAKAKCEEALEKLNAKKKELDLLQSKKFNCSDCKVSFATEELFNKHRKTKSCRVKKGEPHFRCGDCNRIFFDGVWREEDLYVYAPKKFGIRKVIDSSEYDKSSYKLHLDKCRSLRMCELCDITFSGRNERQRHMASAEHKKKTEKKEPMCVVVGKTPTEEEDLSSLFNPTGKPFQRKKLTNNFWYWGNMGLDDPKWVIDDFNEIKKELNNEYEGLDYFVVDEGEYIVKVNVDEEERDEAYDIEIGREGESGDFVFRPTQTIITSINNL